MKALRAWIELHWRIRRSDRRRARIEAQERRYLALVTKLKPDSPE